MSSMRIHCLLAAAVLVGVGCSAPRVYGDGVGLSTNLSGGYRAVNHKIFEGHGVYGLELATSDNEQAGWGYETGVLYGNEEQDVPAGQREGEFNELYGGMRRTWPGEVVRTYMGFGGSWGRIKNRVHPTGLEFDDDSAGLYAHGGALWPLGRSAVDQGTEFLIGFDLRGVLGDDYDYAQAALVLSFGR